MASFVIGIGGASSSGKSTLLKHIASNVRRKCVTYIDLDGYHRYTREERRALNIYPEEIRANNIERALRDILALKQGQIIKVPTYDHRKGVFGPFRQVIPTPLIFVEGLHGVRLNEWAPEFIGNQVNSLLNMTIFVFPEEDIRKAWKVHRDVLKRNYTYERAVYEIQARQPFVQKEIFPQLYMADIVLRIEKKGNGKLTRYVLMSKEFYENCEMRTRKLINSFFELIPLDIWHRKFFQIEVAQEVDNISNLFSKLEKIGIIVRRDRFSLTNVQRQTIGQIGRRLFLLIALKILEVRGWGG